MIHNCIHIGVGGRGKWPWRAFLEREDFTSRLFADINPENLKAAQEACGLPDEQCFDCMSAAMNSPLANEADTVIVITPPDLHAQMCLEAVQRGKHVIVEKPFTKSLAQAKEIVAEADRRGVKVLVTQNRRYAPAYWTLSRLTNEGVYGRPWFGQQLLSGWRPKVHHSGDDAHAYLWERGVHDFDTLRWVLRDEAIRLSCRSFNPPWSPYRGGAGAHAWLEFAGGATVGYSCNFCSHSGGNHFRLEYEEATVELLGKELRLTRRGQDPEVLPFDTGPQGELSLLDVFAEYVAGGPEPPTSGRNNLPTLAMVEGAGIASDEGRVVELTELLSA